MTAVYSVVIRLRDEDREGQRPRTVARQRGPAERSRRMHRTHMLLEAQPRHSVIQDNAKRQRPGGDIGCSGRTDRERSRSSKGAP